VRDHGDPQVSAVYAAEDDALGEVGPRWRRWAHVLAYVDRVTASPEWSEHPATPPIEVVVERRSRTATFAAASHELDTIWIPDGQWRAPVVLHELAHLLSPSPEPHGPAFCGAELWLVRRFLGFDAYGALRSAFDRAGVRYAEGGQQRSASASS
jgi:putative metallohydrolase (TIGR04338 family)